MSPAEVIRAYHNSLKHGAYWCWLCGRELGGGEAEPRNVVASVKPESAALNDPTLLNALARGFAAGRRETPT
jgi:hypothetical protein